MQCRDAIVIILLCGDIFKESRDDSGYSIYFSFVVGRGKCFCVVFCLSRIFFDVIGCVVNLGTNTTDVFVYVMSECLTAVTLYFPSIGEFTAGVGICVVVEILVVRSFEFVNGVCGGVGV